MYVAITRARDRLYLSHAQTRMLHGQTRYCLVSSFLEEIPPALLLRLNRAAETGYGAGESSSSYGGWDSAPTGPATVPGSGLRVGQGVAHAKFGQGVIVACEGRGADARVQVNFGGAGMKWLALEYAKLTPL